MSFFGRTAYRLYFAPKSFISTVARQGIANKLLMHRGMARMEAAAYRLTPRPESLSPEAATAPMIHFLTGNKYWYQTCFCLQSMIHAAERPYRPAIYDDGSLKRPQINAIRRLFPHVVFFSPEEIRSRVDSALPEKKYPALRERRIKYPHIRKLTDVHAGLTGWRAVLDSDMLFFHRPQFLMDWLDAPTQPIYMKDIQNAYGFSSELMEELTGAAIPDRVNVGIIGLKSEEIDWDRLEFWTAEMIHREGTSYLQEQALTAMLVTGRNCAIAPQEEYVCHPNPPEDIACKAALHHYVADTKSPYFRHNWEKFR